jgi:HJR/Mrr/RecB family endonuclease
VGVTAALTDLASTWPLVVTLALAAATRVILDLRHKSVAEVAALDGSNFELKLAGLFHDLGYDVKLVASGQGDLVVEKDGRRAVVQAQSWPTNNPGVAAVNRAAGARGYYNADEAIVVTTRSFKAPARKQAMRKDVQLWDGERLAEALHARAIRSSASPESN